MMLILISLFSLFLLSADAFAPRAVSRHAAVARTTSLQLSQTELTTGDFDGAVFEKLDSVSPRIGKYKLTATVKSSEMNSYLDEYKAEMKRRR